MNSVTTPSAAAGKPLAFLALLAKRVIFRRMVTKGLNLSALLQRGSLASIGTSASLLPTALTVQGY